LIAMRAIHRLIGCIVFIAGIGSAAVASAETQDLGGTAQSTLESASASGGAASGGDVTGLSRDCASANDSGSAASSAQGSDHHSGGGTVAPLPSHRPHLGWQSLLPGSIQ
jgi:hypothetical protein